MGLFRTVVLVLGLLGGVAAHAAECKMVYYYNCKVYAPWSSNALVYTANLNCSNGALISSNIVRNSSCEIASAPAFSQYHVSYTCPEIGLQPRFAGNVDARYRIIYSSNGSSSVYPHACR